MSARRLVEVAWVFLRLGCLSFGGPIAHIGYLHEEFVQRRRWMDEAHFADLVALCQFLPGPASSQVVFALGMNRARLPGALLATLAFTLPSVLIMLAFAFGVAHAGDISRAGWLHGLKLAAVAVVAHAVWGMGRRLCTDRARLALCISSAALLLAAPGAAVQLAVIATGGLIGWGLYRRKLNETSAAPAIGEAQREDGIRGHIPAAFALAVFVGLLVALPVLARATASFELAVFDSFYRSGALVFGGGHVILPLLRAEVVPTGWLTDSQFLAGYAAAQAVPGPMFSFAAYLGASMGPGSPSWSRGLWCLLGIFLPASLLIGGALPFWQSLRARPWVQAALAGANTVVVGVLLAALYNPVFTKSVGGARDAAVALVAFGLLEYGKAPSWSVVAGCAVVGEVLGRL